MTDNRNPAAPTNRDEWMTPEWLLNIARDSMGGGIEFDPCSTEIANRLVGANVYFTKEQDGLSQEWLPHARVFMNPPYSRGVIDAFVERLTDNWKSGLIDQAFVITNNVTDSTWAHRMFNECTSLCFLRGRVHFLGPDLRPIKQTRQGQCLWYFGANDRDFRELCQPHGVVLQRTSPRTFIDMSRKAES